MEPGYAPSVTQLQNTTRPECDEGPWIVEPQMVEPRTVLLLCYTPQYSIHNHTVLIDTGQGVILPSTTSLRAGPGNAERRFHGPRFQAYSRHLMFLCSCGYALCPCPVVMEMK